MVYSDDVVAGIYMRWLDGRLRDQRAAAVPVASWDEVAVSSAPVGWNRDHHGFLCHYCGQCTWQLCSMTDSLERLCSVCARTELGRAPADVWAPRLPRAHSCFEYPGLPQGGAVFPIRVQFAGAEGQRLYAAGDSRAFLAPADIPWMGLAVDAWPITAPQSVDEPNMTLRARTTRDGHQFTIAATLEYDATLQGSSGDRTGSGSPAQSSKAADGPPAIPTPSPC